MLRSYRRFFAPSLVLTLATSPSVAATIVVNSTADTALNDGVCTLREAIAAANNNSASGGMAGECAAGDAATDTITFSINDAGCSGGPPKICTIAPSSLPLPDITAPVVIDGYTQPNASANTLSVGDNAVILIRLDASNQTGTALHLASGSDGSTVSGLSIVKAGGDTNNLNYVVKLDSNNITVTGNFIGVEPDGHTVSTDKVTFYTLELSGGSDDTIGGTAPAARNLLAGSGAALNIEGNSTSNLVQGNYIDLDATGTVGIGSAGSGIVVVGGGNTIGGSAAGAGNVIGTWTFSAGLQFSLTGFHPGLSIAQGNRIGTDASGTVALAAGPHGIVIVGGGGTFKIGGSGAGEGNVIRGAQDCMYIQISAPAGGTPLIQGNHIGASLDGTQPLPCGIGINDSFSDANAGVQIGGTAAGEGNVIAYNTGSAISFGGGATGWAMLGNSMYGNGFGISLAGTGVPTPNDTNDADTGPNNLQNYPVISNVTLVSKTSVQVSGSLNSESNNTYRLEFFANAGCDKSGNGQGKDFLGFADVTTNPNDVSFVSLPFTVPADRHVITATATDPNGNTSEFSLCSNQDTIFTDGLEGD